MSIKLFVLGRPGSGKSSAARRIAKLARRRGYSVNRVNDYDILQEMFKSDVEGKKFRPTHYNGFDVLDFSILDDALEEAERRARKQKRFADIIIIELARNNYGEALEKFSRDFLQNAYFLFLDTDTQICIRRIHNRVMHPSTRDDHFVSEKILCNYYHTQEIPPNLRERDGIDKKRVKIINNNGSRDKFDKNINSFVNMLFDQEHTLAHKGVFWDFIKDLGLVASSRKKVPISKLAYALKR